MEPKLKQQFIDTGKVKLEMRHFAWISDNTKRAAAAATCAGAQGKFWEYHARLFHNQGNYGEAKLKEHAGQLGLDGGAFASCLTSEGAAAAVTADFQKGREMGVTGTPTFFINGKKVVGMQSVETWTKLIEEALKAKGS